jgi:Protein of unknown function (DUF3754)
MGAPDESPSIYPRFIPLDTAELIGLLCADRGLPDDLHPSFRELCGLIERLHHLEYHHRLRELKTAYSPFDPDADTSKVMPLSSSERQHRLNSLYSDFAWMLARARFRHLGRAEIEKIVATASAWGFRMDIDFGAFEHLALFSRGETYEKRTRRRLLNFFLLEETEVLVWRRLVMILKLRQHPRLRGPVNPDHVLLKVFKDIPKMDADMLLPGARVRISLLDKSKIAGGLLGGIGVMCYNLLGELLRFLQDAFLSEHAVYTIAAGSLGYAYKTWYGYRQTKQTYHLTLTQSLYFQTLDSNAGVLTHLFDEAEQQDCRTTILAYYCLWRFAEARGWTSDELDASMECYLDRYADLPLLCEPGLGLSRLRELRLVEEADGRCHAVPLERASVVLKTAWAKQVEEQVHG